MGNTTSQEKKPVVEDTTTIMYDLATSYVISQYLYVTAKLDVATIIGKAGKPLTAEEIAERHGERINVDYLKRILRFLSSNKRIFNESKAEGDTPAFGLTDLSELLRSDNPMTFRNSMLQLCEPATWRAWSHVEDCVMSLEPEVPFIKENGMGIFEYLKNNPEKAQAFNDAMTAHSQRELDTVTSYFADAWKELEREEATVVDLGGGHGLVARTVKQQYPKLNCKVVDLKEVIDSAPEMADGVDFIPGDFFKPDTLPKADVIFMKHILHDWSDDKAKTILESCHLALNEGGKIILCEVILPPAGELVNTQGMNPFALDAAMMTFFSGRERTLADWSKLLQSCQFKLEKIIETPQATCQWIEAHKL